MNFLKKNMLIGRRQNNGWKNERKNMEEKLERKQNEREWKKERIYEAASYSSILRTTVYTHVG